MTDIIPIASRRESKRQEDEIGSALQGSVALYDELSRMEMSLPETMRACRAVEAAARYNRESGMSVESAIDSAITMVLHYQVPAGVFR